MHIHENQVSFHELIIVEENKALTSRYVDIYVYIYKIKNIFAFQSPYRILRGFGLYWS